jgi:predicted GNAT family acetyltransferase
MCWEALHLLRPMLQAETFCRANKRNAKEGYVLYLFEDHKVVSIAGYRIYSMLYCGKMLYIDDLSTLESGRDKGHASSLLKQLCMKLLHNMMKAVYLDSGHIKVRHINCTSKFHD